MSVHVCDARWDPAPPVPAGRCASCYGWGKPIFPWRGRVAVKLDGRCPDCNGSGDATDDAGVSR